LRRRRRRRRERERIAMVSTPGEGGEDVLEEEAGTMDVVPVEAVIAPVVEETPPLVDSAEGQAPKSRTRRSRSRRKTSTPIEVAPPVHEHVLIESVPDMPFPEAPLSREEAAKALQSILNAIPGADIAEVAVVTPEEPQAEVPLIEAPKPRTRGRRRRTVGPQADVVTPEQLVTASEPAPMPVNEPEGTDTTEVAESAPEAPIEAAAAEQPRSTRRRVARPRATTVPDAGSEATPRRRPRKTVANKDTEPPIQDGGSGE